MCCRLDQSRNFFLPTRQIQSKARSISISTAGLSSNPIPSRPRSHRYASPLVRVPVPRPSPVPATVPGFRCRVSCVLSFSSARHDWYIRRLVAGRWLSQQDMYFCWLHPAILPVLCLVCVQVVVKSGRWRPDGTRPGEAPSSRGVPESRVPESQSPRVP